MGGRYSAPTAEEIRYRPKYLQLLWIRENTPLYRRLNLNIVQEICACFGRPTLPDVHDDLIEFIDITSATRSSRNVRKAIYASEVSRCALLPDNSIFVCSAGRSCTCYLDANTYIVQPNGTVKEYPLMVNMPHPSPGIIYYLQLNVIYVFGGVRYCPLRLMKCCEMFSLNNYKWTKLPDLNFGRACFTPCLYSGMMYLCGGLAETIEVFHPTSNSFTVTRYSLSPVEFSITAAESGQIYTVTNHFIYTVDLQRRRVTKVSGNFERLGHTHYIPIILDGVIYTQKPCFAMLKMPERGKESKKSCFKLH